MFSPVLLCYWRHCTQCWISFRFIPILLLRKIYALAREFILDSTRSNIAIGNTASHLPHYHRNFPGLNKMRSQLHSRSWVHCCLTSLMRMPSTWIGYRLLVHCILPLPLWLSDKDNDKAAVNSLASQDRDAAWCKDFSQVRSWRWCSSGYNSKHNHTIAYGAGAANALWNM